MINVKTKLEEPSHIESRNNNDHDNNNAFDHATPKKQRSYIVPNKTKVIHQQMVQLNQEMNYEPVLDKFWEENSDEEYTSITGIMVHMKDVLSLLEPNPIEF